MYEKNLTETFQARFSKRDMDFIRELAKERSCSTSEVLRAIVGEYRRSLEQIDVLRQAMDMVRNGDFKNDAKTDKHSNI